MGTLGYGSIGSVTFNDNVQLWQGLGFNVSLIMLFKHLGAANKLLVSLPLSLSQQLSR